MASSKEATGSDPEREKKTEASEDSGEPFEFTWVSGIKLMTTKTLLFTGCLLHVGCISLGHLIARTKFPGSDHASLAHMP